MILKCAGEGPNQCCEDCDSNPIAENVSIKYVYTCQF